MNYVEEPLVFPLAGEELVGILTRPARPAALGILVVVGGPQYRAGSHRQFVSLARRLGAAGHPVLRFDYRGMGDSGGEARQFEAVGEDIGAAVDAFAAACPELEGIVLWGLCDGASAALLYCHGRRDRRIRGLVLVNPWVRSAVSLARTHIRHYYGRRLLQPEFWRKVLGGGVAIGASLKGLWRNVGQAVAKPEAGAGGYQSRMARAWRDFPGPILLVLSGQDYVAREFRDFAAADPAWAGCLDKAGVKRLEVAAADHTFSEEACRLQLEAQAIAWLQAQEVPCLAS